MPGATAVTQGFLRRAGRCIAIMLVLAQWAVVSHACQVYGAASPPVVVSDGDVQAAEQVAAAPSSDDVAMADCASMDSMTAHVQDTACAAHCGFGDQGDRSAAPALPAVTLTLAYFLVTPPESRMPRRAPALLASALAVATPPHAILHCVRRT